MAQARWRDVYETTPKIGIPLFQLALSMNPATYRCVQKQHES